MNQLLQDLIWNLRSVKTTFDLTQAEKDAICKSLVEEYVQTMKVVK